MPAGQLYIYDYTNTYDAYTTWGVSLSDGALGTLLAPPAAKERISNESRLEDGKRIDNTTQVRYQAREITLEMHMIAPDFSTFLTNYRAFFAALNASPKGIVMQYRPYGTRLYYNLKYLSCTQFAAYNGQLAKFAVRFIEPTPNGGQQMSLTMSNENTDE